MKAPQTYVQQMREALAPLDTADRRAFYLKIMDSAPNADLNTRYRWGILWSAIDTGAYSYEQLQAVEGMKDAHIDTVLRSIVPAIIQEATTKGEGK